MYMGTFMKFQRNVHGQDPSMLSKQKIIMRKQMRAVKLLEEVKHGDMTRRHIETS